MMLLVVVLLLSLPAAGAPPGDAPGSAYDYRSYQATMAYFEKLQLDYPDLVQTWIAQEVFPQILPGEKSWARCGTEICRTLIVRIANKKRLEDRHEAVRRPEVFFSGALHGDERLGPLVVTELAGFLCSQYKAGNPDIKRLVDSRNTWIMPMTNAYGYAHHVRHENGMDPNRDFPYRQNPSKCMITQTGRAVNELFRRHLFQYTLTFHGGMRALTYEWGSYNHMRQGKSTESPDDYAFTEVGSTIRAASGTDSRKRSWYPFGRINDLVYPVDGGLEDWSYAAGFEPSPSPITICQPKTYGGYNMSATKYRQGSVATLVYLAEMDDDKTPKKGTLGNSDEIWGLESRQGHVARNMRMCLKLIELTKPEVVFKPPQWTGSWKPGTEVALTLHGFGCVTLNSVQLLLIRKDRVKDCSTLGLLSSDHGDRAQLLAGSVRIAAAPAAAPCRGMSVWEDVKDRATKSTVRLRGRVPAGLQGEFCAALAADFDQAWARQSRPDPTIRPRSHAVRLRIQEHYTMMASEPLESSGEFMRLEEFRTKLFPVHPAALVLEPGPGGANASLALQSWSPAPPAVGAPAAEQPERAGHAGGDLTYLLDVRLFAVLALLISGALACHMTGWRLAGTSCRRPSTSDSTVIGRQSSVDLEEMEQLEGGVE